MLQQFLLRKPGKIAVGILIAGGALYLLLNIGIFLYAKSSGNAVDPLAFLRSGFKKEEKKSVISPTPYLTPTPTPTPKPLTSKGVYAFRVSHGVQKPIMVTKGSFGPVDVDPPETQTLSLTIFHTMPEISVSTALKLDHTALPVPVTLGMATPVQNGFESVASGSVTLTDTHDYTYSVSVRMEAPTGETDTYELPFR